MTNVRAPCKNHGCAAAFCCRWQAAIEALARTASYAMVAAWLSASFTIVVDSLALLENVPQNE